MKCSVVRRCAAPQQSFASFGRLRTPLHPGKDGVAHHTIIMLDQVVTAQYSPFLERVMTPKRLVHSLGVMGVMGELAEVYQLDPVAALTAGILHDAAKDLSPAQQTDILQRSNIEIRHECEWDYLHYLHGPIGAFFVEQELGLTDPLILAAITTHTYCGNASLFDAPLCWCLRIADLLEPGRDWSRVRWLRHGVTRLREAAYAGRLAEAAFLQTGWLIKWYSETDVSVHPNMVRVYRELSATLNVDDSFLGSPATH